MYAYLRTSPEKILHRSRLEIFYEKLRGWCLSNLGLGGVSWPTLSLYVPGCRQSLHNDARNGRFAFVYSLTLNERRTVGGSTILLKEGDAFRSRLRLPSAGRNFYDTIEPLFNRLVIFDDRLIHGVERVDGSMDPLQGRFVMHGHIEEDEPFATGGLNVESLSESIRSAVNTFLDKNFAAASICHGPLVLRFTILESGMVVRCDKLLDRVIYENEGLYHRSPLQNSLIEHVKHQKFPTAPAPTIVTLPVTFGGAIRG